MSDAAPDPNALRGVFEALIDLHLLWASPDQHTRMAEHVGIPINDSDLRVLYTLGMHGAPLRAAAIADRVHASRPTTSRSIARLVEAELAVRADVAEDGRGTEITLTSSGDEAYARVVTATLDLVGIAFRDVSAERAVEFTQVLRRFIAAHTFEH